MYGTKRIYVYVEKQDLGFISPLTAYITSFIYKSIKMNKSPMLQGQYSQLAQDSIWLNIQ